MKILESAYPLGIIGIAMFLAGIILLGLSGKILPIIYYLFQPPNLGRTKVFLRRYGILFALILIGGITLAVVAAIMLVVMFKMSLLG